MGSDNDQALLQVDDKALRVLAWNGMEGLLAQRSDWIQLLAVSEVDRLGNDPDWVIAHAKAFANSRDLFGWTIRDTDELPVAIFPLRMERKRGLLALSRACLLQDGTFDSEYIDFLIRPGYEQACLNLLLDQLAAKRRVEGLLLTGFLSDSTTLQQLRPLLEKRSLPRRERALPACATNLPSSFEAYLMALKPRMRSKIRSSIRKAEEARARLVWSDSPAELNQELETLFALHQKRWAASGKPGSFAEPERRQFYRELAALFLQRGQLAFAKLEKDGEVLACQFGVIIDRCYYQIQEGYDPAWSKSRVGVALRAMVIAQLIDRGIQIYDFMAGIGKHKTDWGAEPRSCTTMAFALPRWRARLAYGLRAFLDRRRDFGSAE